MLDGSALCFNSPSFVRGRKRDLRKPQLTATSNSSEIESNNVGVVVVSQLGAKGGMANEQADQLLRTSTFKSLQ